MINILYYSTLPIMGSFRSSPDLNKHTSNASYDSISYAMSSMCGTFPSHLGWRIYMEDAHIHVAPFSDKKYSLFGVFDGHGGSF